MKNSYLRANKRVWIGDDNAEISWWIKSSESGFNLKLLA